MALYLLIIIHLIKKSWAKEAKIVSMKRCRYESYYYFILLLKVKKHT